MAPEPSPPPNPAPAPRPAPAPAKEGFYWPTVLLGLGALAVAGAIVSRQLGPRPGEEGSAPAAPEDKPAPLSVPAVNLAAPAPAALRQGQPLTSAGPAQNPSARVAGTPSEDPRRVQPEIETNSPAVPVDPAYLQVKDGSVVGAGHSGSGDPFTDPDALREQLALPPDLSFSGDGGPPAFAAKVIQDSKSWKKLWKQISHGDAPAVDFDRQMLVAVFAGKRKAGVGIEIVAVNEKDAKLRVSYRKTAGAAGAKGPTWTPYHIRAIARSSRPVVFEEKR